VDRPPYPLAVTKVDDPFQHALSLSRDTANETHLQEESPLPEQDVLANQQLILENQSTILANQQAIKGNQEAILANQKAILGNQQSLDKILANQEKILALLQQK
jgi:hypothetical protein